MNIIALADKKWGIGKSGRVLVDIPEDKKLFREETYGKVVVMGRKTYESLPNQSALTGRENIVLTNNIIGGGEIYEQFLPYCDTAHITKVDYIYEADTHIMDFDKLDDWKVTARSDEHTYFDICYEFVCYQRV